MGISSVVPRIPVLLLALSGVALAQSPVIVVSQLHPPPEPGVDYWDLSEAIYYAPPGATIVVLDGEHPILIAVDKPLTIITDGPVNITGQLTVTGLAANEAVVLRGLDIAGGFEEAGLRIDGCAGPVWVEGCTISGGYQSPQSQGVLVLDSLAVHLVRCELAKVAHIVARGSVAMGGCERV